MVYVCLYDAPYYSLNVLHTCNSGGLKPLVKHSLAVSLDCVQMKDFYDQKLLEEGKVFNTSGV